jgi:hypothetical protein
VAITHKHITYGTERSDKGFHPVVTNDGRRVASAYSHRAFDRDEAMKIAKHEANEESGRYSGDFHVVVSSHGHTEVGHGPGSPDWKETSAAMNRITGRPEESTRLREKQAELNKSGGFHKGLPFSAHVNEPSRPAADRSEAARKSWATRRGR